LRAWDYGRECEGLRVCGVGLRVSVRVCGLVWVCGRGAAGMMQGRATWLMVCATHKITGARV